MTPEGCSLYVTLHPQTESPHCYAACQKYICQQLYRLLIMTLEIWWTGHVARGEHEKQQILTGRFGERSHSDDLGVNG